MNTHPVAKRILIYGDSLVYGKVGGANKRYAADTRFTGLLQIKIGPKFDIIEEGLRGRTLTGKNGFFEERDGLAQFGPIVGSCLELELVVIVLGTNDANSRNESSEELVESAIQSYQSKLESWSAFHGVSVPKLLICSPPEINPDKYDDGSKTIFGQEAPEKLFRIRGWMEEACRKESLAYLDLSKYTHPGPGDGVHLGEEGNEDVAAALLNALEKLVP